MWFLWGFQCDLSDATKPDIILIGRSCLHKFPDDELTPHRNYSQKHPSLHRGSSSWDYTNSFSNK